MKKLLAIILLFAANAIAADRVAQQPFGSVRLSDAACTMPEIVAQILPQYVPEFKAGKGVVTDKAVAKLIGKDTFDLCWIERDGVIQVVDEFGDTAALAADDFKVSGKGA